MSRLFYICQRNDQCPRPCGEDCRYTSDFFKSKIYHESVKKMDDIIFLVDKVGNLWEVDKNWKYNLPKEQRKIPETLVAYSYSTLMNWETAKRWETLNKIAQITKKN